MVADNPGTWLFHCHVAEHMMEGMFAQLVVHPKGSNGLAAGPAFLGLDRDGQSLHIKGAAASPGCSIGASCELKVEAAVTVFDAFSVFADPVRLQLGAKSITFKPDRRGVANTTDGSFRVKNVNEFGVVYGGVMELEVTLTGEDWVRELRKLGWQSDSARRSEVSIPLALQIGRAQHKANARFDTQPR
jgi:hypothetical protein